MKRYLHAALAAALLAPTLRPTRARAQGDDAPPVADRMKERLGLSDEQAGKLKDALKAHGDAMKPLGNQLKDGVKKLAEQLKSKASDADIQASLDALKSTRKAMAEEQEKFQDGLASFLTPTQRAKMLVGVAMRMRRRGHDGPP